jgi:hypothetical protein
MIVVFFNLVHTLFQKRLAMHGLCINTLWMMMMNRRHEIYMSNNAKNSIKNLMTRTSHGRQKVRPKDVQPTGFKEGRELVPLVVRNNS